MARLLGASTVSVRRQSPGSYVDGEWVAGAESALSIVASIQPITGKEREDLPEGYRTARTCKLFTRDVLQVLSVENATPGDIVEFDGSDWEVIDLKDFSRHQVATYHRKYTISEIGADE